LSFLYRQLATPSTAHCQLPTANSVWYGIGTITKKVVMKNSNQQQHTGNKTHSKPVAKLNNNKHRPENKDNLDSREGEEQQFKGDDITHNKKEVHSNSKSKKS
jgi:hypothetical protein